MGMVNKVVPHEELEQTAYDWAQEIMTKEPNSHQDAEVSLTRR